jgi:hypothetical protein
MLCVHLAFSPAFTNNIDFVKVYKNNDRRPRGVINIVLPNKKVIPILSLSKYLKKQFYSPQT